MEKVLRIDVWGDIVCPFCYLGKRQLEAALEQFDPEVTVEVHHRAFELDRNAPASYNRTLPELLATKYGMSVEQAEANNARLSHTAAKFGMTWDMERCQPGNTFDAHRLLALAATQGLEADFLERRFQAYFCEGQRPGDHDQLLALAGELGVTGAAEVLASDSYATNVREDEEIAMELGITGVPSILIDGRFMVMGAQGADEILSVLERAWARRMKEEA